MNTKVIGTLGEDIAARYLEKRGYTIAQRNFRKAWGEIDIIAKKDNIVHFCEVKSVKAPTLRRPEENVTPFKVRQIKRMVQTYFAEMRTGQADFQFHVLCVFIDMDTRRARVKMIENVIL